MPENTVMFPPDSLHYQMDRGFHGGVDFQWPTFLDKKYGWTINPTLSNLAPIIWNYSVDTRQQNSLMAGLAGAGLTHPGKMDDEELETYLDGEDWQDKAGAYGIQGDASAFMELIEGDMDTVIGLSVSAVRSLMQDPQLGGAS